MRKKVLEVIRKNPDISIEKIYKMFNCKLKKDLIYALKVLENENKINYDEKKKTYKAVKQKEYRVTIKETNKGNLYFEINNEFIKIKPADSLSVLPGDVVNLKKIGDTFFVDTIIDRSNSNFIVEVSVHNSIKYFKAFNSKISCKIKLNDFITKDLVDGDRIVVSPKNDYYDNMIVCDIVKYLGNKKDINSDKIILCEEQEFRYNFSSDTMDEIKDIKTEVDEEDILDRCDLRNDLVVTIDPATAKDLDDAYSISKTDYGYLVKTHTADVAAYVKYNSSIYKDALKNTTSIYLSNYVVPMFPHKISSGICSLHEGVDRLVRTMELKLDFEGKVIDYKKYKSVINSKKQMNYENVNQVFEGESVDEYKDYEKMLNVTKELALLLNKQRDKRGYLNFESNDPRITYDENNKISQIHNDNDTLSHDFIANIMVLTNHYKIESFGTLPIIYRNHPMPDKDKIKNALHKISELGIDINVNPNLDIKYYLQSILKSLDKNDKSIVLSKVILTSFIRANYETTNQGHYGLGLDYYSHTTSPIRRIVDYMIQYCEDFYQRDDITDDNIKDLTSILSTVAQMASEKERKADMIEYKSALIDFAKFMENKIGETYEMIIEDFGENYITVVSKGMYEGYIDLYSSEHSGYIYKKNKDLLIDPFDNKYKKGHSLLVQLKSVDTFNGSIEYTILENLSIKKKNNKQRKKIRN